MLNDPFDPESLRIDPALGGNLGVKKALLHVPVRKPNRQDFFRTRPDAEYRLQMAVLGYRQESFAHFHATAWFD
jgi:hypothetical protein